MTEKEIEDGVQNGFFYKGMVRANPRNPNRVFITVPDFAADVMVEGVNINRAMDGDTVLVNLFKHEKWPQLQKQADKTKKEVSEKAAKTYSNTKAVEIRTVDKKEN